MAVPSAGEVLPPRGANNLGIEVAFNAQSPLVKQQADPNLLRIDGVDDTFTIYLNGAQLDSFKDGAYGSGMLAKGPISPSPSTAEPSVTMATR